MFSLKESDPRCWSFFEAGNLSVNKIFSATGDDHGIEQENREMKVLGVINVIVKNKQAVHHYFPTVPGGI